MKASFAAAAAEGGWVEPPQATAAAPASRAATAAREPMNAMRQVTRPTPGPAGGVRRELRIPGVPFMCCFRGAVSHCKAYNALDGPARR